MRRVARRAVESQSMARPDHWSARQRQVHALGRAGAGARRRRSGLLDSSPARRAASLARANQIVVDGFEQLSTWNRWRVRLCCRRRGCGLLVTAHRNVGLPGLFETTADVRTAQAIVGRLLAADSVRLTPEVVAEQFRVAGGDLRETLFRLYDVWEQTSGTRGGGCDRAE